MLEALIRDGQAYHDTESARLAAELEAVANEAIADALLIPFLQLATHTIGEHLADWPRAEALAERVLAPRAPHEAIAMAWARLANARRLAGHEAAAAEAEKICFASAGARRLAAEVETQFLLMNALVGSKRAADAAPLFAPALALARGVNDPTADRAIAVASNNLAAELLEAPARSSAADELMRQAADVAYEFWLRCDWIGAEIAARVQAQVALALGDARAALAHAETGVQIIAANAPRPFDRASLHLIRAIAFSLLRDDAGKQSELALADQAIATAPSPQLRDVFEAERAKVFGPR
jgi:hypothetical protein